MNVNFKVIIAALVISLLFMSCGTTQEIEPEPEPEPVEEELFEPEPEPMPEPEPEPEPDPEITSLNEINFDFDKSDLDSQARDLLLENVEMLRDSPNYRVRVEAFTDYVGSDQYNLRLSVRRANAVGDFYSENGISSDRITVAGLGVDPNPCMNPIPGDRGCREMRRAHSEPIAPFRRAAD